MGHEQGEFLAQGPDPVHGHRAAAEAQSQDLLPAKALEQAFHNGLGVHAHAHLGETGKGGKVVLWVDDRFAVRVKVAAEHRACLLTINFIHCMKMGRICQEAGPGIP